METGSGQTGFPLGEIQCFLDTVDRTPAEQMAVDEVALGVVMEPWLRMYQWATPAVSVGYFAEDPEAEWLAGRLWVRRWTGGGAVEHGEDLTFSLILPRGSAPSNWRPRESYCWIHKAVAEALTAIGVSTELAPEVGSQRSAGLACFQNPVAADLTAEGLKIVGGAQRRSRHGVLHQGSIQGVPVGALVRLREVLPSCFGDVVTEWAGDDEVFEKAVRELATARYDNSKV